MIRPLRALALFASLVSAPLAHAQAERFCPNRPDLADSGCTVEQGRVLVEMSGVDWTRSETGAEREDQIVTGDVLARIGIADHAELQLGWGGYGRVRTRDASGRVRARDGIGDVRVGLRRNLVHPDGEGFTIALEPFVGLPIGGKALGAGDWAGGLAVPANLALSERWTLNVTGQAAAAADEDRSGQHLSLLGIAGLTLELSDRISASGEVAATHDDDPAGRRTEVVAGTSLAWQPRDRLQVDLLAVTGLSRAAPDFRLVAGGAILF